MNKCIFFFIFIIIIITIYEFSQYFNLKFEGFSSSSSSIQNSTPSQTTYDPCPKCTPCPKLKMLNVNTLMSPQ